MHDTRVASTPFARLAKRVAVTLCAVATITTCASCAPSTATSVQREQHSTTTVSVNESSSPIGTIGDGYVGLSFESSDLSGGKFDNVGDLAQLMRNLGNSVMRFGGIASDVSFTGTTSNQRAGLARLAKASGWNVIYTENIGDLGLAAMSSDARAISKALGSSLSDFACGNEPEFLSNDGVRQSSYSLGDYLSDAANCIAAIRAVVPNAHFEGPDTVTEPTWPTAYAQTETGLINKFGIHFYPLQCGPHGKTPTELASTLFSQSSINREVWWFKWAAADARTSSASLWFTEVNTACGGGDRGLSNSYASALWIIDYLLLGAENGVSGMNVHGGLDTNCDSYTPLCQVGTNEYKAQPIYYGMLFTHLLGSGNLLPVTMSSSSGTITAFALKSRTGGIRLIIENLNPRPSSIRIQADTAPTQASVLRLTAPSLLASAGVNIQGATVSVDGTIRLGVPDSITCTSQGCPMTIAPYSAILVALK